MSGSFELSQSSNGQFRFVLKAGNGQVILSSEQYEAKASAENGIASVKNNAGSDERYARLTAKDGSPYFTLKAANHQVIGSSQMYSSEEARDNGIASVKQNAPGAEIKEV